MELYKKSYKGIFKGKNTGTWKITRYTLEEVMEEILEYINEGDEGTVEILEMDVSTKKTKVVKLITIVNDLYLEPKKEIPLRF
ncbi:MAG: hypothetical protein ACFFAS_15740 [Promethearchaeota archaeon]